MSANSIQDAFLRWDPQVSSPFTSLSRRVYPRTVREVFSWGEEMWLHHGLYSQAIRKAVRYFITEIEMEGEDLSHATRNKYKAAIEDLGILTEAANVGDDYIAFGNSFTSVYQPFSRDLACKLCSFKAPIRKMENYFKFQNGEFKGTCPGCRKDTHFDVKDIPKPIESSKPKIIRWPPQFMEINHHPISSTSEYRLDLPRYDELRNGIMQGNILFLEETPMEIINAVVKNQKFKFEDDQIFHMKYPPVSCFLPALKGWGLPPFMAEFETALLVHMMDKYTEAILVDYLIPFRVLTPPAGNGTVEGDPMLQINAGTFQGNVKRMIAQHRRNPTDWNFLPFPLQYQTLGGEAKDIVPIDIQEHFEMRLLNSMGIPSEFYKGSFGNNAGPIIGFKFFERNWQYFSTMLNKWVNWVTERQGEFLNWEKANAKLVPVSMHEDPEIRSIKLELAAGNQISKATAYRPIGIDVEAEMKRVFNEEDAFNEAMQERQKAQEGKDGNAAVLTQPSPGQQVMAEEEAAAAAQGGGGMPMPGGGGGGAPMGGSIAPQAGGGAGGASLDDIMLQADQIAQQLLTADPMTRRSTLTDLKHSNETLHAQVKQRLTDLEQQAKSQGLQLVRQGQAPPPTG